MNLERPLPSSEESERVILGGILLDNHFMVSAAESLGEEDFYSPLNRRVFAAMIALFKKQKTIDPIVIGEELKKEGSLESIGGVPTITNLSFGLPYFSKIDEYVTVVREKALRRRLIRECTALQSDAQDEQMSVQEIVETGVSKIQNLADSLAGTSDAIDADLSDLAAESLAVASNPQSRKLIGTGLADLDIKLGGGIEPGSLVVIGARPSQGKTALALQMATAAGKAGHVAMINSLEMPRRACMDRLISSEARINLQDYRNGNLNATLRHYAEAAARDISQLPLIIDDQPSLSPLLLRSRCRRILAKRKRLDLIVVDYLQLMRSDGRASHQDNRRLEIESFTRALKLLAMELSVPIICLSQLSRAPETRKAGGRPILSDLRESGSIEQDADVVILIHRPEAVDQPAELIVAKHRNGPTGIIETQFLGSHTRFENLARKEAYH